MKCCFSCKYWAKTSKKVPVDVKKVPKKDEYIEVMLENRKVYIHSWEWVTNEPITLKTLLRKRLCFYGKGVIEPWDECENYLPKYSIDVTYCKLEGTCEFSKSCPKFSSLTSYIS
ncbi:MAG: hypothetical protein QW738_04365 [Nitrososphaeria archaeon]